MPRSVGVSPWSLSRWPTSCRSAAVIVAAQAPAASASVAHWSACSSCVTGSPEYILSPLASNRAQMSGIVSAIESPRKRIRLDVGKALHRLLDAFLVAEPRVLDPAKRSQLEPVARHFAHVDGSNLQLRDQARDVIQTIRAYGGGEPVVGRIGDGDRVVDGRETDHRRDRTESFLLNHGHVGLDFIEHRR